MATMSMTDINGCDSWTRRNIKLTCLNKKHLKPFILLDQILPSTPSSPYSQHNFTLPSLIMTKQNFLLIQNSRYQYLHDIPFLVILENSVHSIQHFAVECLRARA